MSPIEQFRSGKGDEVMHTVQEFINQRENRFGRLSRKRQQELCRAARRLIASYPHMANASTFWRGLSANQVIAAATR